MNNSEEYDIVLPLTQSAYLTAMQFAAEQVNPDKAEKVRLNTLAICLVDSYLTLMGIVTNLTGGDSWNPLMRMSADVADLEVTGVGYLECIAVEAPASSYSVPPEVWSDRIGYVVVQIDDRECEGTILGFSSRVENGSIARLESWDGLLVLLDGMLSLSAVEETVVNLSQWVTGIIDRGWQTIDDILAVSDRNLTFSFRGVETESSNGLARGKVFNLSGANERVILLVEISNSQSLEIIITLQLHPADNPYLPAAVRLQVLDNNNVAFATATSTDSDNYLQLQINGSSGENFQVEIAAENTSIRENFVI